jgi:seryl-tRNA synthetase
MIDVRALRESFDEVAGHLSRRGVARATLEQARELDEQRRRLITEGDELRAVQKQRSREIGQAADEQQRAGLIDEVKQVSARLDELEPAQAEAESELESLLAEVPNLPARQAPDGEDEADAAELRRFGHPVAFDFEPADHVAIGERLGLIDVPRAAKVSGSRFAYLTGQAVMLEFALVRYVLDRVTESGFTPVIPPVLTRREALFGTAFLPTGADQLYRVGGEADEGEDLYLVGTSEVPLAGMHMDEILGRESLPLRYAAFSTCFRREAGAYGKDTRGIFRVHQFDKVEMFTFAHPDGSWDELERLTAIQESLLADLELSGRVVDIAVGDLGASASRKYDCEVWLPGQGAYRELTSASNCTDYQARRLRVRYRTEHDTALVHTLNATACAVGRTLVALLETHQLADGTVRVPEALQPYFGTDHLARR